MSARFFEFNIWSIDCVRQDSGQVTVLVNTCDEELVALHMTATEAAKLIAKLVPELIQKS